MADIFGTFGDVARSGPGKSASSKRSWDEVGPKFSNKHITFDVTAVQEPQDGMAFAGVVASLGTLAAVETPDTAAMAGEVSEGVIVGTLAAIEAPDAFTAIGTVPIVETPLPRPRSSGGHYLTLVPRLVATGTLEATEAPDDVSITLRAGMRPDWARYDEDLLMMAI